MNSENLILMRIRFPCYSSHRILVAFVLLLNTLPLNSQGLTLTRAQYLSAAPSFEEPADDLGLLPDTPKGEKYILEFMYLGY